MGKFMDVHSGFYGTTQEQLTAAHNGDLAIQAEEGVSFEKAWLDPVSGKFKEDPASDYGRISRQQDFLRRAVAVRRWH